MKYQHFFIVICIFFTSQSCKKDLPTAPTIITGKVVDENNMPVFGVNFHCGGLQYKGLSAISTFDIYSQSDKNGIYTISVVVPNGTDQAMLNPESTNTIQLGINYDIYLKKDGVYTLLKSSILISDYGATSTFDFQIRKK